MTVNSTTNRVSYTGNGTTNPLSISFPFQAQADLLVIETVIATGAESTKVLDTDYTITGTTDANGFYPNGGSVVPAAAIASTSRWTIIRDPELTQLVEHVDNDPVPAASLDNPVDKLTMIAQRLSDRVDRAITFSDGDVASANGALPSMIDKAGKVLAVNDDEDGFTFDDPLVDQAEEAAAAAVAAAASVSDLWFRPVLDRVKTPPTSPSSGDRYLVHRQGTTGVFIGKENQVAEYNGSSWVYTGAPLAGQTISMRGMVYQYQIGREDESSSYFWRLLDGRKVAVPSAPTVYSFGDSILLVPNTTDCFPARVAAELGGTNDNQAVSGTGIWNAAHHLFAKPQANKLTGNYLHQFAAGHNNCVYTADATKNATTAFHEMMAVCAYLFGTFQPASAFSTVGSWTTDTGDALGVKPIANQSGAGSLRYSTSVGAQLNGTFTGERFILHALRGDGVSANRCSDIAITIDGSSRTPFVDDGDFEYLSVDGTHIGHAVLVDNKWGKGSHSFTLAVGANATASRPAYIDGVTSLRPPAQCTPLVVHLPLRPDDLTPTTSVGAATATDATFRAFEAAIRKALSYFPEYPWTIVDPNAWVDGVSDFADHEHPGAGGANRYMWAVQDRLVGGEMVSDSSYTPTAALGTNAAAVTPSVANWYRVGDVVTVFGFVTADPTSTGDTRFTHTLPVAPVANFSNSYDLSGSGSVTAGIQQALGIFATTGAKTADFNYSAVDNAARVFRYQFSYRVK